MDKLKIGDVRKELPFKTHQVNLWWSIGSLHRRKDELDYNVYLPTKGMHLQRPFCWTIPQQQQLILSIIKGIYIPKFCVLVDQNTNKYRYEIIDGKQRLYAMMAFLSNEFPLPTGHYFKDCDIDLQHCIKSFSPVCEVEYFADSHVISDDAKIQWFEMINFAGTPQDEAHLLKLKNNPENLNK